jgi:putrescine transport system substrate-binding protein
MRIPTLLACLCFATAAQAQERIVNVYNWADYIAPETVGEFEKASGIKVNYDTFDSQEMLEAKLKASQSGYDVVVPALTPFLGRQVKAGFYRPLDRTKLPNYSHLDSALLKRMAVYDPDNAHAVPWLTGTTGLGYNVEAIARLMPDAPLGSLHMILDPAIVARFKECGVMIIDSPTDIFPITLNYLGLDSQSNKPEDLQKAADLLIKIRPYIRKFDTNEYFEDLAGGDICLTLGYSSDINQAKRRAREVGKTFHVAFAIPTEGTIRWVDTLAIPVDSPHPDNALAFINFLMGPKIVAESSNALSIRNGNADSRPFVRPDILADPGIYPPPEVEARLFTVPTGTPESDRLRTRLWTKIKNGV